MASAIITGSVDIEYMNDIIASDSAPHIDAHVLIDMATAIEERGDDLVRGGDYLEAFLTYMAVLNGVQHGYLLPGQIWTVDGGASARLALGALLITLRIKVNDARRRLEEMGISEFQAGFRIALPKGRSSNGVGPVSPTYCGAVQYQLTTCWAKVSWSLRHFLAALWRRTENGN
ncbi:hypothetical protein OEA41_007982 [Lepraria neglecta]|uniref:Uncharacterized protein n=1 Tax=Lepraria neglecta TaxID=209136 RepID=A0AAD9ZGK4_9LECA|nr:hypothetical protein OEA41_007982 [Lepraria neglecta]